MMMETQTVSETLDYNAREDVIAFSRRESLKSYTKYFVLNIWVSYHIWKKLSVDFPLILPCNVLKTEFLFKHSHFNF
jgi:hypothetical protein